jgi:hypothetical protein
MKTYLHIHHLDPGEEEEKVVSLLENDGIFPRRMQEEYRGQILVFSNIVFDDR